MPRAHPPYPPEYRQHIIELVRSGRTPEDLAREFEPTAQCIRDWVKAADRPQGTRADGLTQTEHEELIRLRRENKILRQEKEILKKRHDRCAHHHRMKIRILPARPWQHTEVEQLGAASSQKS